MGAASVVTGVFAKLEEFLDIQVPGFQVGTHGALAFTALINSHGSVIDYLEKGYDTL